MFARKTLGLFTCLTALPFALGHSCLSVEPRWSPPAEQVVLPAPHDQPRLSSLPGQPWLVSCSGGEYFHYSYGERLTLTLDVSRFGLFAPAGLDAQAADELAAVGVGIDQLEFHGIQGWYLAPVPTEKADACGVEEIIGTLAGGTALTFATPVFLDEGPILITPKLVVGFNEGVSPEQAEAILNEASVGEITDRNWAGSPRIYRLRAYSRNGFEVLDAVNRLAPRPEVLFAEPNVLFTGRSG